MGSDLLTKNNNDSTIIKSLSLFNNTKSNAQIRTFLQNEIYKSNKDNYSQLISANPELSIIQAVNKDTGEKEDLSLYDNLDEIDIQYPEVNVSNTLLYSAKEKLPQKININLEEIKGKKNLNENLNDALNEDLTEGFANKKKNNNGKPTKTIESEMVDCMSFVYKLTGVFLILVAILVILKLMKKI
jgi:hypothetical protein